jgi:enamine deaminase RidA (YjgF/YER057c/UK114 family)
MIKLEKTAGLAATPGYEYARLTGNQLHVAGQVPHNSAGQLVGGMDPRAQAVQCLTNLNTLLSVHGFSTCDIQRLVVYVVGEQENLAGAWAAIRQWFPGAVPPATLLGVACLGHPGQLVEVDATIVKISEQAQ